MLTDDRQFEFYWTRCLPPLIYQYSVPRVLTICLGPCWWRPLKSNQSIANKFQNKLEFQAFVPAHNITINSDQSGQTFPSEPDDIFISE